MLLSEVFRRQTDALRLKYEQQISPSARPRARSGGAGKPWQRARAASAARPSPCSARAAGRRRRRRIGALEVGVPDVCCHAGSGARRFQNNLPAILGHQFFGGGGGPEPGPPEQPPEQNQKPIFIIPCCFGHRASFRCHWGCPDVQFALRAKDVRTAPISSAPSEAEAPAAARAAREGQQGV